MALKRRKAAPASPETLARRRAAERAQALDPASWGVDVEALRLATHADVEVRPAGRGQVARARREDVFDRLHARGALSAEGVSAVRRFQQDLAVLHRTAGGGRDFGPRVDISRGPEAFGDVRLEAGRRLARVLDLTGAASARLLSALCEPAIALAQAGDWRAIVGRESGERLADAQTAVLRTACENLAGAYRRLDEMRRIGVPRGTLVSQPPNEPAARAPTDRGTF
jgi:hypothetical protein